MDKQNIVYQRILSAFQHSKLNNIDIQLIKRDDHLYLDKLNGHPDKASIFDTVNKEYKNLYVDHINDKLIFVDPDKCKIPENLLDKFEIFYRACKHFIEISGEFDFCYKYIDANNDRFFITYSFDKIKLPKIINLRKDNEFFRKIDVICSYKDKEDKIFFIDTKDINLNLITFHIDVKKINVSIKELEIMIISLKGINKFNL